MSSFHCYFHSFINLIAKEIKLSLIAIICIKHAIKHGCHREIQRYIKLPLKQQIFSFYFCVNVNKAPTCNHISI